MTSKESNQPEVHLFIIWEKGRASEKRILKDIKSTFDILRIYEVTWSSDLFSQNLSRFYGASLPPGSRKEQHCGTGPFLAVIVEDTSPDYQKRATTKGEQIVNTKLFDAKARHRDWTGGGHRVHGTNSVVEADHNLTMLFGKNSADLRIEIGNNTGDRIHKLSKDLEGHDGWRDLRSLFYVLNSTIDYVALRNFEPFPDKYYAESHGDIDLLVRNYHDASFVLNASPVFRAKHRVHVTVPINGELVKFDLRFVGDRYYDQKWQDDILETRILGDGFYRPSEENHFYGLLYHALVQKPAIADDYGKRLISHAKKNHTPLGDSVLNRPQAIKTLVTFLKENGYTLTQPRDKSVYVNPATVREAQKLGIKFVKAGMPPLRNYLKTAKSRGKHYVAKAKRIIRRKINRILTRNYDK